MYLAPWRTETATKASMVVATRGERGSLLLVRPSTADPRQQVEAVLPFLWIFMAISMEDFIGWRWLKHVEAKSIKFVQFFSSHYHVNSVEDAHFFPHCRKSFVKDPSELGTEDWLPVAAGTAVPGSSWGAQVGETIITTSPFWWLPSGKLTVCYGKSPCLMGKSTISMAIFNSYVKLPEGKDERLKAY